MLLFLCTAFAANAQSDFEIDSNGVLVKYNGRDNEVVIPDGVTAIGNSAFSYCYSLMKVTIPNSVLSIGKKAFYGCSLLTSVTIPNSVTSIGEMAFNWCGSLMNVTIPDSVTRIEESAFRNCSSLTNVTIPNRVTSIETMTFYGCSSLTSVTIPDSVTSIGNGAFSGCSSLTSVTIPNSVTSIGGTAFSNCSSLTSVTIPNSVTSIGNSAFYQCSSLTIVTIPNSVTSIGAGTIPDSTYDPEHKPNWYSFRDKTWIQRGNIRYRTGIADTYYAYDPFATPKTTALTIKDPEGKAVSGESIPAHQNEYQLSVSASPAKALQRFLWISSNLDIAVVDNSGKVTFLKEGTVKITVTAIDGSKKSDWVRLTLPPRAESVTILNAAGEDITGKEIEISSKTYQLKVKIKPDNALQKVSWFRDNLIASVDSENKVTFSQYGTIRLTAKTDDGSNISVSVTLKYVKNELDPEIRDTNIRGKNKEIQVIIPWSDGLVKTECKLYDDSTGEEIKPTFRERMDSTGKNKVVSWVGTPLVNGNVYRFKIRVSNGVWSNYVEKYAMPISNVYGATVVAGNKSMIINTQHREPATGTRYMVFDAATQKELAYKAGTKTDTTWKYEKLTNGKLYYVVAVPYRDYMEQRLWGPNENRIYFMPMGIPSNGKVSFSGTNATVSITADSLADGIRVLYRPYGGALKNGCEAKGTNCTISGLDRSSAYEFYAMKYKVAAGKTYYSTGTLIPYNGPSSGLSAPQMNPVVAMSNSGYTTFTIKKSSNAEGISVLYKIGNGNFQQACEKAGNSCATTLDTSKNYTFYIMQYRTMNGKKVYSPGIVARDYTSGKAPDAERLYYGFSFADESIDMNEIYDALDGYMGEDALLMAEAFAVMWEDLFPKDADEFEADAFYEDDDFDYSDFDTDDPYGEYDADDYDSWAPDEPVTEPYNEYADDSEPWEDLYEPNDESGNGSEEPVHEGSEPEEKELYMYRFDDDSPVLPPAPSFGNL